MAWLKIRRFLSKMCNGSSMFNSSCCARKKIVINITESNINVDQLNSIIQNFVSLVEAGDKQQALTVISDGLSKLRKDYQTERPLIDSDLQNKSLPMN